MSLLVKICGITCDAGIVAAREAGADAVGFVFHAVSPRNLAPERAAELARALPESMLRVAVTLHPSQALVNRILACFRPDAWQSDLEDFATVRIPDAIPRWPVLRSAGRLPPTLPRRLLFDAPVSGAGLAPDWAAAASLARRSELIIAGGLTPATVARAVTEVEPMGVDVSSGVERSAGVKDPALIREFVAAARAASPRLQEC